MAVFNSTTSSNPAPLGYIAPTAGTPKRVTSNFTNATWSAVQSLSIQAHPNNGGLIYILSNSTAADTTNGTNIIAALSAGQSLPLSGVAQGGILPSQFYIDTDNTGDVAIVIVYGA